MMMDYKTLAQKIEKRLAVPCEDDSWDEGWNRAVAAAARLVRREDCEDDPDRSVDEIIAVIDAAHSVARKVWAFAESNSWAERDHRHLNLEALGEFLDKSFPGWRKDASAPADPYDEDEAEGLWVRARQEADADEWEPGDEPRNTTAVDCALCRDDDDTDECPECGGAGDVGMPLGDNADEPLACFRCGGSGKL